MESKMNTREKILTTAAILFQKNGYHATGLNEIIKESATPKGSLYYYFPNGKEELAAATIKLMGDKIQHDIKEELAQNSDPVQAIKEFILDLAWKFNEKEDQENCFSIGLLALETVSISDSLRKACTEVYDMWTDTYYQKLVSSGLSSEKAKELSLILQLMIEGAITISLIRNDNTMLVATAEKIPVLLKDK
ncbi:Transcriptional regulator, TetR family [Methanosarcina horonobensis HB-1 = JCM 15518]|uniref:Transcriptional regulator, TetR family n=1 Tax=Methanosarcina horonobensis HB-1 = JCM 15518 TaxID=1434110 RepID=A0A0E3SIF3_9EURY|nr:TetR/AcrR family transcriptional regulator [Methanosarcina horonobensis]AKB79738.1 Transcriptional regulator, TetR family [Methanosarcina horonobensis HB-1 = JCM 15518]